MGPALSVGQGLQRCEGVSGHLCLPELKSQNQDGYSKKYSPEVEQK